MNKNRIILIAGMSGVGINESIKKYISNYYIFSHNGNAKPEFIKLEKEIEDAYYRKNPNTAKSYKIWINDILQLPYISFQSLWHEAFDKIQEKIDSFDESDQKRIIFLNLHMCYYHAKTQEYLPFINVEKLKSIKPEFIITFIDDIYEIFDRLSNIGGIFFLNKNNNFEYIFKLLRLLAWRSNETMIARFIGKEIGIENYVFAVKHPMISFNNLVDSKLKKVYLSHPITAIRILQQQNRLNEVKSIINEITEISNKLCKLFATFLPTTIDEFRIDSSINHQGKIEYKSSLLPRWEQEHYHQPDDCLYVKTSFDGTSLNITGNEESKECKEINELLGTLTAHIKEQVTVRDYTLVEQSDILVIYRPFFNGHFSNGVQEEFNYYNKLLLETKNQKLSFVFSPQIDFDNYRINIFEKMIRSDINNGILDSESDSNFNLSQTEKQDILIEFKNENDFQVTFEKISYNHKLKINLSGIRDVLGKSDQEKYINSIYDSFKTTVDKINEIESKSTYFEKNEISIDEFINNINTYLN